MCTVLLTSGVNVIAVNKYVNINISSIRVGRWGCQRTELRQRVLQISWQPVQKGHLRVLCSYVCWGTSYLSAGLDDMPDTACQANNVVNI
jgi:hypothetical protein